MMKIPATFRTLVSVAIFSLSCQKSQPKVSSPEPSPDQQRTSTDSPYAPPSNSNQLPSPPATPTDDIPGGQNGGSNTPTGGGNGGTSVPNGGSGGTNQPTIPKDSVPPTLSPNGGSNSSNAKIDIKIGNSSTPGTASSNPNSFTWNGMNDQGLNGWTVKAL